MGRLQGADVAPPPRSKRPDPISVPRSWPWSGRAVLLAAVVAAIALVSGPVASAPVPGATGASELDSGAAFTSSPDSGPTFPSSIEPGAPGGSAVHSAAGRQDGSASRRVVAVGDVHGAFEPFTRILQSAGIVDEELRWSGGDSVLVQTGDITDRGSGVRRTIDLLMRLQEEAPRAGGRVVVLLGNHELQNLVGEYRGVAPGAFAAFVDPESEERRRRAWRAYRRLKERLARIWDPEVEEFPDLKRQEWMAEHPLGYVEYVRALGPEGEYGAWLRSLPVAVEVDGTIFSHAGIGSDFRDWPLERVNREVREDVEFVDELRRDFLDRGWIVGSFDLHATVDVALMARDDPVPAPESDPANPRSKPAASADSPRAPPTGATGRHPAGATGESRESIARSSDEPIVDRDEPIVDRIEHLLQLPNWSSFRSDGLLWFRGYENWPDRTLSPLVEAVLEAQDASRLVVGHNVQDDGRIRVRLDGKVALIDTGMLASVYQGRPSALQIDETGLLAIYPASEERLEAPASGGGSGRASKGAGSGSGPGDDSKGSAPGDGGASAWRGPEGEPLPFEDVEEIEEFLSTAEIVDMEDLPVGVTGPRRVRLEKDGIRARAVFHDIDLDKERVRLSGGKYRMYFRDWFGYQCAAYELSRLLGVDVVPPAVPRRVKGITGSLQLWIEDAFTERERAERGKRPPDALRWARQVQLMKVFDYLVANDDRNAGNILIDPSWKVWLIDHTRTFQRQVGKPKENDLAEIRACPRRVYEALGSWDRERVDEALEPFLEGRQIDKLLERADRLRRHLESLIDEHGEGAVLFDWPPR